jgi:hypothetical protein
MKLSQCGGQLSFNGIRIIAVRKDVGRQKGSHKNEQMIDRFHILY